MRIKFVFYYYSVNCSCCVVRGYFVYKITHFVGTDILTLSQELFPLYMAR